MLTFCVRDLSDDTMASLMLSFIPAGGSRVCFLNRKTDRSVKGPGHKQILILIVLVTSNWHKEG